MPGRLLALALLCGCGQVGPPSGYADLHASPLHALVDGHGAPDRLAVHAGALLPANARLVVLSLGQAGFEMGARVALQPEDVPAALSAALQRFGGPLHFAGDGPAPPGSVRWVAALEGGSLLRADPVWLATIRDAGVRLVGFAHTHHDRFVRSAAPPAVPGPSTVDDHSRLTEEGRRLVHLLRQAGLGVDLSHLGRAAFDDTVAALGSGVPLLVSHTAARALCDRPRNLSDAQARRVARSGGLVGVVLHGPSLRCDQAPATVGDVARHLEHLARVMGPAHVALGTDWDGRTRPPPQLRGPGDLGRLERALASRGMPREHVRAILYGNVVRWFERHGAQPTSP